jgi:betaine-aldehyde dehydrogenase
LPPPERAAPSVPPDTKERLTVTVAIAARDYQNLIDGAWAGAADGSVFERVSPAHDVVVGRYPASDEEDLNRAVAAARRAFDEGPWPMMPGVERARILNRVAEAIRAEADDLALVEALESGKPVSQARDEIVSSADLWEYAATLCRHTYGDTYNTLGPAMFGMVLREPVGVVGMITPWNFPLLIISQKLPFALAVGCTAVVKPAEITPGTTLRMARMAQDAGLPDGVLNVVTGPGSRVGGPLAAHPDVDMISFTGSTAVGRRVIEASQGNLKKVELELGGKNPQIVFADADLEAALDAVVYGVYFNMGECCNSGSRLLVQRSIADEFIASVVERARTVPVGDPLDPATKVGAIATDEQFGKILELVDAGRAEGADLLLGGGRLETASGRFMEPTVFAGVEPTMRIAREEIFGPVLSVLTFDTPEEAARIANSTPFGLSAGVWTRDLDTAIGMSRAIRVGTIWVNTFLDGYPELPFGGYKESGLGREFGRFSIDAFTELKSVQMHLGPRTSWWMPRPGSTSR